MESMKRVDVLKGIEQILVQKAYETGHVSHRADGDWQKTNNGWVRVKGSPAQSTPQTQEPAPTQKFSDLDEYIAKLPNTDLAENSDEVTNVVAEYLADHGIDDNDDDFVAVRSAIMEKLNGDRYGEITEEDLIETPEVDLYNADQVDLSGYANNINIDGGVADNDDLEDVANQILLDNNLEVNDENMNKARDAMLSWLDANGYLDSDDEEDSNDWEEEDTEGYYGNSGGLRSTVYEGAYDTQISNIGNTEEDDYGNSVPNDEAVENVVRGIMQEWTGDTDDEDAVEAVHDGLKDAVLDRWSSIYVQKSAVRDMRSAPATKNMGF